MKKNNKKNLNSVTELIKFKERCIKIKSIKFIKIEGENYEKKSVTVSIGNFRSVSAWV